MYSAVLQGAQAERMAISVALFATCTGRGIELQVAGPLFGKALEGQTSVDHVLERVRVKG